ncbi:MAG TPA: M20/M25/M40 family metallo-hydrolase [Jatrophihabitantaceae bacterium]|nr:M20/M25/M40 family metallo-hydrolase [Jatrophihabitantaceae bacterium]
MDDLIGLLRLLVEHESPTGSTATLRDLLLGLLRDAGADAHADGEHIVAHVGEGAGHVLVLGHFDTVWPVGRLAEAPFTVSGEEATGPGVFDMKGGLVSLLYALKLARPARPVRIVLTADEEIGSPDGARVVEQHAGDAVAVFGLEPPLPGGTLKVGRRGVARVRITVRGREAHAGLDVAAGVSAIDELIDHVAALRRPSVNVGTISGGTRANVVAGHATAELGLRFATPDEESAIFARLDSLTPIRDGATISVETLTRRPAWEPSASTELAGHVRTVARELGETIGAAISPGAGDANLTGARGIPTVDGLGPRGHGAHARDETVELPSIRARGELLARLLTVPR